MKPNLIFLIFILFFSGPSAFANTKHKILVVIGYVDYGDPKDLLDVVASPYNFPLAAHLQSEVLSFIAAHAVQTEAFGFVSNFSTETLSISVLNVNELCSPEEKIEYLVRRVEVCPRQLDRSKWSMDFLRANAQSFEEIIYLGHARGGRGFGLGPNHSEFTLNLTQLGFLKRLMIVACDSESNYAWYIRNWVKDFVGTSSADGKNLSQLVNLVVAELRRLLSR